MLEETVIGRESRDWAKIETILQGWLLDIYWDCFWFRDCALKMMLDFAILADN
jgi:hypothetical protein